MPNPWTLECRALDVARGERRVLHDVNLTIAAGECVTLIGPNGSGKTTLLLALLGLLSPAAGSVRLNGAEVARLAPRRRGRFAAYVPQGLEHVPAFTVYDFVAFGRFPHVAALRPLGVEDHAAVSRAIVACRLTDLASRPLNAISGGERQKALLAAALAQDAEALFLDEPNTALDPAYLVELVQRLRAWHAAGRTLVLISHDLHLPAALGGRVVALRAGRVAADGTATDILAPERLSDVFNTRFQRARDDAGHEFSVPAW
jgi:iron complex transport system ATP-binding protein